MRLVNASEKRRSLTSPLLLAARSGEFFLADGAVLVLVASGELRFGLGGVLGALGELFLGELAIAIGVLLGEGGRGISLWLFAVLLASSAAKEKEAATRRANRMLVTFMVWISIVFLTLV